MFSVTQLCPTVCCPMECRPLCPWHFPGKNTGVGCHFLLPGIFPTQGSNPRFLHLLHWQADSLTVVPPKSVIQLSMDIYLFFFKILFPYRLSQNTEQISQCYTLGPCWLSIIHVVCVHVHPKLLIYPYLLCFLFGNHKFFSLFSTSVSLFLFCI